MGSYFSMQTGQPRPVKMTQSDAGIYRAPDEKQLPRREIGMNARYNDKYTELRESQVTDSQGDQTTVFAKVPRSNCSDIRLADLLVQSG